MDELIKIVKKAGYGVHRGIILISEEDWSKETTKVKQAIIELCSEWDCCCEDPDYFVRKN